LSFFGICALYQYDFNHLNPPKLSPQHKMRKRKENQKEKRKTTEAPDWVQVVVDDGHSLLFVSAGAEKV